MPTLYRMQPPGSTNRLSYGLRSFYGVNSLAATPADYDGINEALDWTRRVETAATVEHTTSGVHRSQRIPRAVIALGYNYSTGAYSGLDGCYNNGATGPGVISSVALETPGVITITLASALPSTTLRLLDFSAYDPSRIVRTCLLSVTSTTVFMVGRFEADYVSYLTRTHGPMTFAIFCGV